MSQYAHFPVKGDTFWQRYRNACFQWIKWWDFPVMTCAECGVRIIPSIPAMILNDVCYMIGLFFLPLGIVFSGLASAVDLRYLLSLACFLLWFFTIAGLSTLLAVLLPWKQLGESPKTDRFRCTMQRFPRGNLTRRKRTMSTARFVGQNSASVPRICISAIMKRKAIVGSAKSAFKALAHYFIGN